MEKRSVEMMWPGHGTSPSEMGLKTNEPQKSSPPVKQWIMGVHQQSLKSKVDNFTEIVSSPVQCRERHDDVTPLSNDFTFRNTALYSVSGFLNNNTHKMNGKPRDSTTSRAEPKWKQQTKTDFEKVRISQSLGRQDFQSFEQVTLCSEDTVNEPSVHRLQNYISNPTAISPPDFPSARNGFSLDSNVLSPDLHTDGSRSSNCTSNSISSKGTQVLSADEFWLCPLKDGTAVGLPKMCTVESLLQDGKERDRGKVREGAQDLSIQTNVEEGKGIPADSVNASPLAGLPAVTPINSSCYASSGSAGVECRTREDCKTELSLFSAMSIEVPQTPYETLHSPGSSDMKGPHPGKSEEGGACFVSAIQSGNMAKPEMQTTETLKVGVKLGERNNERGEEQKPGNDWMGGQLTVTRAMTRVPKANPEFSPHASLGLRGKVKRKSQNKGTRRSCKHEFVSEIESFKEEKEAKFNEQFEAAPGKRRNITERLVNKSAPDLTSDYRCIGRSGRKNEIALSSCVNTNQMRSKTMGNISSAPCCSVDAHSSRMDKEFESAATGNSGLCSSEHSGTRSAKTAGCLESEEKEREINLFAAQELAKRPELGVQSRQCGEYVGRIQCADLQLVQTEMSAEGLGNETGGQGNWLYRERTRQRRNDNNSITKDAKQESSHQDTDTVYEVEEKDGEEIICSRDFQSEGVSEPKTKNDVKSYLKETYKLRLGSVKVKESYDRNTSSQSNLVPLKKQGELQSTVNESSNIHLWPKVSCNDLRGNGTQELTPISLPMHAETSPLIPGQAKLMQNIKEASKEGGTTPILSIPCMDTSPKSKKRKSSRKACTCRRNRCSRVRKDAPIVVQEPQRNANLFKMRHSISPRSRLKRRHSCPESNPPAHSPRTSHMLAASPFGRIPCSPINPFSHSLPHPSSVKRARRHTVCSLEVEREIAPLCLRKEVYPFAWTRLCGSGPNFYPNLPSSPKTLASCFLASPLAFLSSKHQNGSSSVGSSFGNCLKDNSSSSCPSTSSVGHPLFPVTTSSVPTFHQSSASVFSVCSVSSLRDEEEKLKQENAEGSNCFKLELGDQERCDETSRSNSEIKMENTKQREHGKVSQIKIRKTLPKPVNNLTPMGLPKPVRLKKEEFSLEEIYTNKNFHEPPDGRLETIFEVPVSGRDGSVSVVGQRRIKRFVVFPEVGMPRKPRRPAIKSRVSRKAVESSNLVRTRRGGNLRTSEGCILNLQEIERILCSKLEQLDTWVAFDERVFSV